MLEIVDRRKFITSCLAASSAAAIGTLPTSDVEASSMGVRPTRVEMSKQRTMEVFTVENRDTYSRGVIVQVLGFEWIDPSNPLAIKPTRNLLITPPSFRLAPKAYQKVRVGLRSPLFARRGSNYRVIFRHIPESGQIVQGPARSLDFKTAINMNIPIYIR